MISDHSYVVVIMIYAGGGTRLEMDIDSGAMVEAVHV